MRKTSTFKIFDRTAFHTQSLSVIRLFGAAIAIITTKVGCCCNIGCYAGGYYAMGLSRQAMPGQNTICFYAFGHISHCHMALVVPYKSHGKSSRRKKLWQHKMKLCALRVHFSPTGQWWLLDLIMSPTWTNTFSLQVVAGTRVHYSWAEGEQILHFFLCISCLQTALLR